MRQPDDDNARKAEWTALMCLIAEGDRDLYRELLAEAYEAAERAPRRRTRSSSEAD
jgi:hypothetical protein